MKKYFETVADAIGRPVWLASVTVTNYGTATPSSLFSDAAGTAPIANPLTTDSLGYFEFYAADGRYSLTITGQSFTTRTITDILLDDPVDATAVVVIGGSVNNSPIGAITPSSGAFTTLTSTGVTSHTVNSASAALTVTQTGSGHALVVEDSATTDSTPFAISATGNVGIGGAPNTAYRVLSYGPATGSTSAYGFSSQNDVQSDVTSNYSSYRSAPGTQATAFTLTNILHYGAEQGTIGAGSSVTNQYGFYSGTGLIAATNNFGFAATNTSAVTAGKQAIGFYSTINIAAGGGTTYAMYFAGTAYSYMSGNLGIGITPIAAHKVYTYMAATDVAVSEVGSQVTVQASNTSGAANKFAIAGQATAIAGYAGTGAVVGVRGLATIEAAVTVLSAVGVIGRTSITAAGTVTNAVGFQAEHASTAGTTTNAIGFYAPAHTVGTNAYGFYSDLASGANRWNIYANGTANNALNGNSSFGKITAPTSAVDTTSLATRLVTISAATYTVLTTDHTIIQTTAASTYTLPAAASFTGRRLHLVTQFAGAVISASSNVVPIAGGAAGTAILPATAGKFVTLHSNGTNWVTVAAN